MIRKIAVVGLSVSLTLALAACGETQGERGLSGAAIGAGAGAAVGAVTGIGPATGAVIGGVAGGATGVLTTPSHVDVGKPAYRNGAASDPTVRDIQAGLQRLGYNPGPADGRMGPKTAAAIRKYQQDNGMAADGQPSQAVLDSIRAKG